MSLFYSLVNKVCLNSFVIYVWNNDKDGLRSEFLRCLGKELLREQLELRLQSRTVIQRGLQNTVVLRTWVSRFHQFLWQIKKMYVQVQEEFGVHIAKETIERPQLFATNAPNQSVRSTKYLQPAKTA